MRKSSLSFYQVFLTDNERGEPLLIFVEDRKRRREIKGYESVAPDRLYPDDSIRYVPSQPTPTSTWCEQLPGREYVGVEICNVKGRVLIYRAIYRLRIFDIYIVMLFARTMARLRLYYMTHPRPACTFTLSLSLYPLILILTLHRCFHRKHTRWDSTQSMHLKIPASTLFFYSD